MRKLVVANWKENPKSEKQALALFRAVAKIKPVNGVEVVVCPPFIYLECIADVRRREKKRHVVLGAQDVFWEEKGPYTSEVGPRMLKSLGVRYVIVGHSERRKWLKETDAMINKKVRRALRDGLRVILCVGESLPIRKKGTAAARKFVEGQLKKDLAGVPRARLPYVIVAYEPIWAIGTGCNARPEDAALMADAIKKFAPRALYGGSVDSKNIADYVQCNQVSGVLVGGASIKAGEFKKIIINI
ncbi:MAG: triose-phosphate isomerase [Minisyncoccia bacterium]